MIDEPASQPTLMSQNLTGFIAYPSSLREVRESLSRLPAELERRRAEITLKTWETNEIVGYCLVDPILEGIDDASFVVADITRLNFNVLYEIGFAIAKRKRVVLISNRAIKSNEEAVRELGVLDTLGHKKYQNTSELCQFLQTLSTVRPLAIPEKRRGEAMPFFVCWPNERTESEIRLLSRIKKQSRIGFRQFDPTEDIRLSINRALESVADAEGIILPLISSNRRDAEIHNLRCSFLAGLSHGQGKETLLLQAGTEPVPLDYRDAVAFYNTLEGIDRHLADFTPKVYERTLQLAQVVFPELSTPVEKLYIGQSAAENEHDKLEHYYIRTEEFQRVLRGEIQIITGRKGSGKTALFYQVRNKIRRDRRNVVLDLNPEGFQLRKLKTLILDSMEEGTQEHTITAFWEYLVFLELCHKLLEKDSQIHLHDHALRPKYLALESLYRNDAFVAEGDFAERLLKLVEAMEDRFHAAGMSRGSDAFLTRHAITEFLYQHDIAKLKTLIVDYLSKKEGVWILFDNIDKGWAAHGVDSSDLLNLRCLVEALRKLSRELRRSSIPCTGVVFMRNDIFELLVDTTPDRGKVNRASLDWTDPDLLLEMLRRRFVYAFGLTRTDSPEFDTLWNSVAVSHLRDGTETYRYMLSRSLMRPRALLELLHHCKSHAVNLGHSKIEEADFLEGEKSFSTELVAGISLEIQDVFPEAKDSLYAFVEIPACFGFIELTSRLSRILEEPPDRERLLELLFWYGFLGFLRQDLSECFIYSVGYDMRKFKALLANVRQEDRIYVVNPAFFKGLEIQPSCPEQN